MVVASCERLLCGDRWQLGLSDFCLPLYCSIVLCCSVRCYLHTAPISWLSNITPSTDPAGRSAAIETAKEAQHSQSPMWAHSLLSHTVCKLLMGNKRSFSKLNWNNYFLKWFTVRIARNTTRWWPLLEEQWKYWENAVQRCKTTPFTIQI